MEVMAQKLKELSYCLKELGLFFRRLNLSYCFFPYTLDSKNTSQNKVLTYSGIFSDSCICNEEKYNKSVKVYGNFHLLLVISVLIK